MKSRDEAIADDFERGWSDERLDAAEFSWGPGIVEALPRSLSEKLAEQARRDGVSEMAVIRAALDSYLPGPSVA